MEVSINYWAVLLATASSMVVGSIWYTPSVFGKIWAKLARVDMSKSQSSAVKPILATLVVSFITAYVLAHMTYVSNQFFQNSYFQDAVTTAFWLWLGFVAARFITHDAFEGRPVKLTALNVAHEFVTVIVMGMIIGGLGV